MKEYNQKLCDLLERKRSLHNFIEREAKRYPVQRTRAEHRAKAKELYGWNVLMAEIKALTFHE